MLALNLGFFSRSAEVVTFDAVRPGSPPPGWIFVSGTQDSSSRWQVMIDRSAPSRPYVLTQAPERSSRQEISLAVFDRTILRDGEISVNLEITAGRHDKAAGLVWRFKDPSNYYFAVASADRDSVSIWKRVNARLSPVAPPTNTHRMNEREWNLMRVTFRGPKFAVFIGHRKVLEARDEDLPSAGRAGVWTKADTAARFDNFRVDKRD